MLAMPAEAITQCRVPGYRTVITCGTYCSDATQRCACQYRALFPGEDDIRRNNTLVGAVLGGVIAYAMGRPDLVLGAIIAGGVIGGVLDGRDTYIRYRVARANGNMRRALSSVVEDRRASESYISSMAYDDAALVFERTLAELELQLENLPARAPRARARQINANIEFSEELASLLGSTHTNSQQGLQISDDASVELARAANVAPTQGNATIRTSLARRGDLREPYWQRYRRVRRNAYYVAQVGRQG